MFLILKGGRQNELANRERIPRRPLELIAKAMQTIREFKSE